MYIIAPTTLKNIWWCVNNRFQQRNNGPFVLMQLLLKWMIWILNSCLPRSGDTFASVFWRDFSCLPQKCPLGWIKLYFIWKTPLFFSVKRWRDFGVYVTWDCSSKHKPTQIPTWGSVKVTEKLRRRLKFALNTILTVGQLLQALSPCSSLTFVFASLLNEQYHQENVYFHKSIPYEENDWLSTYFCPHIASIFISYGLCKTWSFFPFQLQSF